MRMSFEDIALYLSVTAATPNSSQQLNLNKIFKCVLVCVCLQRIFEILTNVFM